jgi:hypothetical protein
MKNIFPVLFMLCLAAAVLSSCHNAGCMNKDAVNFDITADEDDGSCVVCQTKTEDVAYKIAWFRDSYSNSPHYNQLVAMVYMHQFSENPNDKLCGGVKNNLNIKMKNISGQTMYMQSFTLYEYSGPVNISINSSKSAVLPQGQIVDLGDYPTAIIGDAASIPITLDSVVVYSNSLTYY